MQKNNVIPQMFDVKPVDRAGDLDWQKIQSVRNANMEREKQLQFERMQKSAQQKMFVEREKKRLEEQQRIAVEKAFALQKAREEALLLQKIEQQRLREELFRKQMFERQEQLRKIAEYNKKQQEAYNEAVRVEKEDREREEREWLEKEMQAEKETLKKQDLYVSEKEEKVKAGKKSSFFKKHRRKRSIAYGNINNYFSWSDIFFPPHFAFQFDAKKSLLVFVSVSFVVFLGIGSISYASKGWGLKGKVLGASEDGYANMVSALSQMAHQNFEGSSQQFSEAYANFSESSQDLEDMGGVLMDTTRFIPFASKISSGKNAVEAGKHFSAAGQSINEVLKTAANLKSSINSSGSQNISLLDVFKSAEKNITDAKKELDAAQENVDRISVDDLPENKRDKFLMMKQKLPEIRNALDLFLSNSHIFVDLLGGNGPRKYLFLFQNNSEMRATGGFIGSYGLLDIANGHIKNFFIDGIFNPDGQLKDKIVPPSPIQKISAAWSMHDSNWFPNFPMSAQKAIMFYEKTGGPTADGVITFTPTLMQKLLEITGPIEMSDYGVTLDANNFIELTQYEVEVDYDKEENKPKKILSDLAPIVLEKLLASKDLNTISKTAEVFLDGLSEKHILLYSQNQELQKIISQEGWSGEILSASKDYLSVVNSNINGFKTDAVIDENIDHHSEIQPDGSIVDTVTITRKHRGGNSQYEWLNKVNADYMRVYVPEGSKLLEVSGQTRETNNPPLDYDALGFKRDSDVQNEENSISIDPESGTQIYNECGKTVFANWTYVSPQEEITIRYKYLLPFNLFKVLVSDSGRQVDSYSLVIQKQSGSLGSLFTSNISFPENYEVKWNFPDGMEKNSDGIKNETSLKSDVFEGVVFQKKQ